MPTESPQVTGARGEAAETKSRIEQPTFEFSLPDELPDDLRLRELLEEMAEANLIGPENGETEEIDDTYVSERYLCGMIAPRGRKWLRAETEAQLAADSLGSGEKSPEEGPMEPTQPQQVMSMFPSSIGFTFTLPLDVESLVIEASFGHYTRVKSETGFKTKTGDAKTVWKRRPVRHSEVVHLGDVDGDGNLRRFQPDKENLPDVWVQGRARKRENEWIISLFLVNDGAEPDTGADSAWLFQAKLRVQSPDGAAIFKQHHITLEEEGAVDKVARRERMQLAMSYRKCIEFAAGHNTSVHATRGADSSLCAISIESRAMPKYEVERQDPPAIFEVEGLEGLQLGMTWLCTSPREEVVQSLRCLEEGYRLWIERRRAELSDPAADLERFKGVAKENLEGFERALSRISAGISVLQSDDRAFEAFQFANETMALQRVHTLFSEERRRNEKARLDTFDIPRNRSWRPFQLAFILLNLPSLCNLNHPERTNPTSAVADLLWFPTGGGKTEAYLGLTAFTLAIRRLQGKIAGRDGGHGVAVLMRYTLRLLTLQQFQRASALICACELTRRKNPKKWGDEPFRLGLWVGAKTTPNSTDGSAEAIENARGQNNFQGGGAGVGSPAQLTNCPWCGAKIEIGKDFKIDKEQRRTFIHCPNFAESCPFTDKISRGEGIPALVVDEEIYRRLPSLLIATVDKFAQMPWNGRTAMLFGQVNGLCPRHGFLSPEIDDSGIHQAKGKLPATTKIPYGPLRPPDLIIQDELHLISGPLGTLVGLYETAVDALCSWKVNGRTVRPKVVASTATIRNAKAQMHALFLRDVEVFPPPGLDADDNFFSRRAPSSNAAPGRLYVGVCAPGKRIKAALIRVYTAYMAAAQTLYLKYGRAADPFLTTVGYFSSMRELGGMRRLVDDDVTSRLRRMKERGLEPRSFLEVVELTSRRSATDIPDILDQLGAAFDPVLAQERKTAYKENQRSKTRKPIDVLLATNMISVGVDVPRLGLMIVAGQPKSTSEYIQATSRVGRQKPGLVCTVFNWARPRDLSHFERFEHYHATFYQHVEALSVTPFAPRALDRGLTALLVALIRLEQDEFNPNKSAQNVAATHQLVKDALQIIETRAANVTGSAQVGDEVRAALKRRLDEWSNRILHTGQTGVALGYQRGTDGTTTGLLEKAGDGKWDKWTCLNSLRDVEPMCNLVWSDGGLDA